MSTRRIAGTLIVASALIATVGLLRLHAAANGSANTALITGIVKDAKGAPVEGAFVKLKNADRHLTFMVISQEQGQYTAKNLPAGNWVVQGVGNGFQSTWSDAASVADGGSATVNLALTDDQPALLPFAWPGRQPGDVGGEGTGGDIDVSKFPDGDGKQIALGKCAACHPASRMIGYQADRQRWKQTIDDMRAYMAGSTLGITMSDREAATILEYLAKNNFVLGEGGRPAAKKPDPNSRLPRTLMTGAARKYVAVEFEIPTARTEPHEISVDADGNGWVTQHRVGGKLGRLDPRTLTYTEVTPPPAASKTVQLNAIWAAPGTNKLWFMDVGPNRRWLLYDTSTKEFSQYAMSTKLRTGAAGGNTMRVHPNGTVWYNAIGNNTIIRFNPKTKEFTGFHPPSGKGAPRGSASPYGMAIAGDGSIWVALQAVDKLGKVDPVTGDIKEFDLPKGSVPRKGGPDADGNVWFGLHGGGKIVKVDARTDAMTFFEPPTKNSGTYCVSVDMKHNLVWVAQHYADMIARFDPKTGVWTEFPLPNAEEDHRRIEVDQKNPNRIWWSGNDSNRMGYIEVIE